MINHGCIRQKEAVYECIRQLLFIRISIIRGLFLNMQFLMR